jgi:hypothetical protein
MEEWKKVLTAGAYYQVEEITAATDASGFVNISALDSGSATRGITRFRALEVAVDGQPFSFVEPRDYPFAARGKLRRARVARPRPPSAGAGGAQRVGDRADELLSVSRGSARER